MRPPTVIGEFGLVVLKYLYHITVGRIYIQVYHLYLTQMPG